MRSRSRRAALWIPLLVLLLSPAVGLGAETFPFRQVRITVPGTISDMVVADINRDGYPDVALIDYANKTVRTFLGGPSCAYPQAFALPLAKTGRTFVGAGDFNGDGAPDLAVNVPTAKAHFAVLPGDGAGGLLNAVNVPAGKIASALDCAAVLDLNNDGRPDVVGIQQKNGAVLSFLNLGGAKFKKRVVKASSSYDSVVAGNFDTDKKNDAVFGEFHPGDRIYYYKSKGDGAFRAPKTTRHTALGACLVAGDLNGDRKLDLVGDGGGANDGWSMLAAGTGLFTTKKRLPAAASFEGGGVLVKLGTDAKLDLATGETAGIALFAGNGNGSFASRSRLARHLRFDKALGTLAAADVNRDGRLDLIGAQWDHGIKAQEEIDDWSNLILFLNGQLPNTLAISNLATTKLSFATSVVNYAGSVSFQSTSGDLKFFTTDEITDNAYLDFRVHLDFPSPEKDVSYHYFATGSYLNKPGEKSGSFSWDMALPTTVVSASTPTITLSDFYLLDYHLVLSNGLLTKEAGPTGAPVHAAAGVGKTLSSNGGRVVLVGVEVEK
ncbi:MAG: VCBS repeat-containing protein [Candidatus Aminicenantes bacterium]|nr:VCBS repeat-containing protein [Candidatus Aminicenantes bacterium]